MGISTCPNRNEGKTSASKLGLWEIVDDVGSDETKPGEKETAEAEEDPSVVANADAQAIDQDLTACEQNRNKEMT